MLRHFDISAYEQNKKRIWHPTRKNRKLVRNKMLDRNAIPAVNQDIWQLLAMPKIEATH